MSYFSRFTNTSRFIQTPKKPSTVLKSSAPKGQPSFVPGTGRLTYSRSSPVYERRPIYQRVLDEKGYQKFVEQKTKEFEKETGAEKASREEVLRQKVEEKQRRFVAKESVARQLEAGSPAQTIVGRIQAKRKGLFDEKVSVKVGKAEKEFQSFFEAKKEKTLGEIRRGQARFESTKIVGYETVPVGTTVTTTTKWTGSDQLASSVQKGFAEQSIPSLTVSVGGKPVIATGLSKVEQARLQLGLTKEGKIDYSKGQSPAPTKTITSQISQRPTDPVGMFLGSLDYAVKKTPEFFEQEYGKFVEAGKRAETKIATPIISSIGLKEDKLITQQIRGGVGLVTQAPALGTGVLLGASRLGELGVRGLQTVFDVSRRGTEKAIRDPEGLQKIVVSKGISSAKFVRSETQSFGEKAFSELRKGTTPIIVPFKGLAATKTGKVVAGVGSSIAVSAYSDPQKFATTTAGSIIAFGGLGKVASKVSRIGALKAQPTVFRETGRGLVEGGIVRDVPVLETFKSGKLIPIKQQAGTKVLSSQLTSGFVRKGQQVIVQRVPRFSITQPKTYLDKLLGRAPGQIKKQFFAQKQVLLLKDTPSQFAGRDLDSLIGGIELYVAQVSPQPLPFTKGLVSGVKPKGELFAKGLIKEPRFQVQKVPGASGPRLFAGGTERGLFLAPAEIKRETAQAYIYYASQKGSFYDVLTGRVGVSVKGADPRILLAKEKIAVTPSFLKKAPTQQEITKIVSEVKQRGASSLAGKDPSDVALYARLARERSVAGTIQTGAAAQTGVRGEFEVSAAIDTIFKRANIGTRGVVKNVFGVSDVRIYYPTKDIVFGVDLAKMVPSTTIKAGKAVSVGAVERAASKKLVSDSSKALLPYDISKSGFGFVSGVSVASRVSPEKSVVSPSPPRIVSSVVSPSEPSFVDSSTSIDTSFSPVSYSFSETSIVSPGPSSFREASISVPPPSFRDPSFRGPPSRTPELPSFSPPSYDFPKVPSRLSPPRKPKRRKFEPSVRRVVRPVFEFKQPKRTEKVFREKRLRNIILPVQTDWLKSKQYFGEPKVETIPLLPSTSKGFKGMAGLLGL